MARRIEKKKAIADEKRRWRVLHYTNDGKPDKKRRPGQPWDPSVYAGAEKNTYSGGSGVDLLAHLKESNPYEKKDPVKEAERALDGIALQTYLEEVNTYEQLLNPLLNVMKNAVGAPPGKPSPTKYGFGPMGEEITDAFHGIGALPPEWKREVTETVRSEEETKRLKEKLMKLRAQKLQCKESLRLCSIRLVLSILVPSVAERCGMRVLSQDVAGRPPCISGWC